MNDNEKVIEYEMHIEGMLKALKERLEEFSDTENMSEFEQGRQTAFIEMMDIIKTRHEMILELIEETN